MIIIVSPLRKENKFLLFYYRFISNLEKDTNQLGRRLAQTQINSALEAVIIQQNAEVILKSLNIKIAEKIISKK